MNKSATIRIALVVALAGQSAARADEFFEPRGMDARTQSKAQRVIADHLSTGTVEELSPETVTIGRDGDTICQQGVIQQGGNGNGQSAGDIILVEPINVCIDK